MFPSFMDKDKHPRGLCVPCCFGRPTNLSKEQKDAGWKLNTMTDNEIKQRKDIRKEIEKERKEREKKEKEIEKELAEESKKPKDKKTKDKKTKDKKIKYKKIKDEKARYKKEEQEEKKYINTKDGSKSTNNYDIVLKLSPKESTYKYMYEPKGKGTDGAGPTYNQDEKTKHIDLKNIVGTKEVRPAPALSRIIASVRCDQGGQDKKESIKIKKIDDAPLLETFPLLSGQIGYIPLAVQIFLGYSCRKICQRSPSDHNLKEDQPCLLHKGMEKSENQSFLACIADIYTEGSSDSFPHTAVPLSAIPPLTIKEIERYYDKTINY